jgi:pimeloyl-ACP methyl ester carboxylesterase
MPVMLIYGDSDMYRPEHEIKFYQLLGGGLKDAGWQRENMSKNRLAILPGVTHYDMFTSPQLPQAALPFLDGKMATVTATDNTTPKK